MKRLLIVLGVIALLVTGYFGFIYNSCQEPQDMEVAIAALNCAQEILSESEEQLRTKFCAIVNKPADCELVEEDREAVFAEINSQIHSCTKKTLKEDNLCVDKVEQILRGN